MNYQSLTNWVQIFTGIAVLVGLGLVVWELRQSREIALAQLTSDFYMMNSQHNSALMGENPAEVIEKACDSPEELTKSEYRVLRSRFGEVLDRMRRSRSIAEQSGLMSDDEWRTWATGNFGVIFNTHPGRAWWDDQSWLPPDIRQSGNRILAEVSSSEPLCKETYRSWVSKIEESKSKVRED